MQPITEIQREVLELYRTSQFDKALVVVVPALGKFPEDGRLWEIAGLIHRATDNCAEALHALEMATMLVPLSSAAQCALADCYRSTEREELAGEMYQYLLTRMVQLPNVLLENLAFGLESVGEVQLALRVSQEAARREPTSARNQYLTAYFMTQVGFTSEAVAEWAKKAVQLAPEETEYRVGLSGLVHQSGRIEEAYDYVKDLTIDELREIPCGKCLRRLAELYETFDDELRQMACLGEVQRRIAQNEMEDCGGC
ncbi:MAG: hypothetical protein MK165_04915 [Pirellulaceae bacterium]|nr:hypothetical protein [Pirellulaceae bacterium]